MLVVKEKSSKKVNIKDLVMQAGIIGAGGAGFPTHVKLSGTAEMVIANGAECEPLLESDRHLMLREPEKMITGLKTVVEAVGAKKGVIAIKRKHEDVTGVLKSLLVKEKNIELFFLENFYPAGDEHVLVHEVTGRVVPMGGIPLNVGVVVDNVYTLAMIAGAVIGKSFTQRYVTVTGAVKCPAVAQLPVGMSIQEAIEKVGGGAAVNKYKVIVGGPMMGKIEEDTSRPILKTTSGIIVLPEDNKLIRLKTTSMAVSVKRGKSVCCQCSHCTEMCPRFLLGHDLKPHVTMRVLASSGEENVDSESVYKASLCCECGLCGYYTCTMGLAPNIVNGFLKGVLSKSNIKSDFKATVSKGVNSFIQERKVPTARLIGRLGLMEYNRHLPFLEEAFKPEFLEIPLKQHIGASAIPIVNTGDVVKSGDLLAKIPEKSLGANIHCPLDGKVKEVTDNKIIIVCT